MLESAIKEIQRKLQKNILSLNHGGCIHFAYYFSKKLTELNIEHKNFLLSTSSRYKIINNYSNFEPVSHVMVYIKDIGYIDGHKTLSSIKGYVYHRHTKLNLDRFRKHEDWNSAYKKKNNKIIEQVINTYLK